MSIISIAEGARRLGIKKQSLHQRLDEPFFVEINGMRKIDDEHPSWKIAMTLPSNSRKNVKIKKGNDKHEKLKNAFSDVTDDSLSEEKKPRHIQPPAMTPEIEELTRLAAIADMQDTIYATKIKEEKSKQEEIKTLELKKDLAPMYLLKHFYGFAENMIHRSYRRFHEISPELNALYLAGKIKEAEQLLIREQETIVRESQAELVKAIKEEGFSEPTL